MKLVLIHKVHISTPINSNILCPKWPLFDYILISINRYEIWTAILSKWCQLREMRPWFVMINELGFTLLRIAIIKKNNQISQNLELYKSASQLNSDHIGEIAQLGIYQRTNIAKTNTFTQRTAGVHFTKYVCAANEPWSKDPRIPIRVGWWPFA